jgi:hypothetical protein
MPQKEEEEAFQPIFRALTLALGLNREGTGKGGERHT